jgi:hypothetical protein
MSPWLAPAAVPVRELESDRFGQPPWVDQATVVGTVVGELATISNSGVYRWTISLCMAEAGSAACDVLVRLDRHGASLGTLTVGVIAALLPEPAQRLIMSLNAS